MVDEDRLREMFLTETLPAIANAISSQIGRVNIFDYSGGRSNMGARWLHGFINDIVGIADRYGFDAKTLLRTNGRPVEQEQVNTSHQPDGRSGTVPGRKNAP